ncbi:lipopolysaccharide kinase InaA family protein [Litchfieldella rifensis]|uniref:Lipopolysaccharide kinase InaA family protein n=1 Tax=Litchfieldella rifensis TaxID=762643 RepID=A0ABV7LTV2_9GAMM
MLSVKLLDIPFDDARRRYLVFQPWRLPDRLRLASTTTTQEFEQHASSRFYVSDDQALLAKVVPDKFDKRRQPFNWFARDYLEKRWLLQTDAHKEFRSLRILRKAGLRTPTCHGWGLSLNPRNRNASLLLMEYLPTARPGGDYFESLDEAGKRRFLERFVGEVIQLARSGFVHRDLHYNNLLVTASDEIVWIDAHVRPLPAKASAQWHALAQTLTINKLRGETYRAYAEQYMHALWHSETG